MVSNTIREILVNTQEKFGECDAVRWKKNRKEVESRTYSDLKQDSESFSCSLSCLGLIGSHIALIGATSYNWIVAYLGIVDSGSVAVPLDASLPAEDLWELIDRSDAKALVVDGTRVDVASLAKEKCPQLRYVIRLDEEEPKDDALSFSHLLKENSGIYEGSPKADDLCTILFTSGTTGKSKGVMLTHRNLANNATCLDMKIPFRTVLLTVLPIHHAYCLSNDILKGISLGAVICINDSLMHMAKNILFFEPDIILMVPQMIETIAKKLEDAKGAPVDAVRKSVFGKNLKTIISGGAYLNPEYIDLFASYGITIQQGYGMTECSPVISTNVSWDIRKDTVGQLLPNCEAKSVDSELWVKGSSVMLGYYKMPQETAETLEDGWLKTGDLGYVDEDHFVHLTGRKKNLIITKNGENVSPEEIENALSASRLVKEILVQEKDGFIEAEIFPDLTYAEQQGIPDIHSVLQQTIDEYNQHTAPYKRVFRLTVRETEFEKTASGKIKRQQSQTHL